MKRSAVEMKNVQEQISTKLQVKLAALQKNMEKLNGLQMSITDIIQAAVGDYRSHFKPMDTLIIQVTPKAKKAAAFASETLYRLLQGKSLAGRLLWEDEPLTEQRDYQAAVCKVAMLPPSGGTPAMAWLEPCKQLLGKLLQGAYSVVLDGRLVQKERQFGSRAMTYVRRYIDFCRHKEALRLMKIRCYNKDWIDAFYQRNRRKDGVGRKKKAIVRIYENYVKGQYSFMQQHSRYFLVQHLMTITSTQFEEEFEVHDNRGLQAFVNIHGIIQLSNQADLRIMSRILKYIDQSIIVFMISNSFRITDFPDNVIRSFFDSIDTRLQNIDAPSSFLILHRVQDGAITKMNIPNGSKDEIERVFRQHSDGKLYDLVIVSSEKYEYLGNVRIRYLNYINSNEWAQPTLKYPKDLVAASLHQIKIVNLNQCVNLKVLNSWRNNYKKEDLEPMKRLRYFSSESDKYVVWGGSLLADLMKNNRLVYVHVQNSWANGNILGRIKLSRNIAWLRYLNLSQQSVGYDITLDLTEEFPQYMTVYAVVCDNKFGNVEGPEDAVARLERGLIHDLGKGQAAVEEPRAVVQEPGGQPEELPVKRIKLDCSGM